VTLTPAELAAAKAFRASQRAILEQKNASEPPDITVDVHVHYDRHDCAARGGKSVSLELREHYVFSPEYFVYASLSGPVEAVTRERKGRPGVAVIPAKRFGWIWTEGRCPQCGMTARCSRGRLVDPAIRPPSERAVVS
jgi:hypothetical protein